MMALIDTINPFNYFKIKRAITIIRHVEKQIETNMRQLDNVERASVLIITNRMSQILLKKWGKEIKTPQKMKDKLIADIIIELSNAHNSISSYMKSRKDIKYKSDMNFIQAIIELRSIEILINTLGVKFIENNKKIMSVWKLLMMSRTELDKASDYFMDFKQKTKSDPIPKLKNEVINKEKLNSLGQMVPIFFKRQK